MSEGSGKELPKGWVASILGDICFKIADGSHNPPPACAEGLPMLSAANIANGSINFTGRLISPEAFELENRRTRITSGDVLLTIVGTIGRSAVVPSGTAPFTLQRSVAVLKAYQIDPRFLSYQIQSPQTQRRLEKEARGTAQKGVYLKSLSLLGIEVAPLPEQTRIADKLDELLSDLDAGVAALEGVRAKLKQYRAAVLKAAVEGALTEQWRRDHPTTESAADLLTRILAERRRRWEEAQLQKFKDQGKTPPKDWRAKYQAPITPDTINLPELPTGWCWATMEQTGEIRLGRQRAPQHHFGDHMRPYLRVANVYEDRLDLTDVKEMNFTPEEFNTYSLRYGDILLNEGQSPELVGRPAMYRDEIPGCCYQKTLLRFRAEKGVLEKWALTVFRSYLHSGRFRKSASITTSIAHLAAERFIIIEFPLPPLDEQTAIVEQVEDQLSVIDHLEADLEAKLKSAQALRQSILRDAFEGKLVSQDPNDEPACELLKRIAAEREARSATAKAAKKAAPSKRVSKAARK